MAPRIHIPFNSLPLPVRQELLAQVSAKSTQRKHTIRKLGTGIGVLGGLGGGLGFCFFAIKVILNIASPSPFRFRLSSQIEELFEGLVIFGFLLFVMFGAAVLIRAMRSLDAGLAITTLGPQRIIRTAKGTISLRNKLAVHDFDPDALFVETRTRTQRTKYKRGSTTVRIVETEIEEARIVVRNPDGDDDVTADWRVTRRRDTSSSKWWVFWDPKADIETHRKHAQALTTASEEQRIHHAPLLDVRTHPDWPNLPVPTTLTAPFDNPSTFARTQLFALAGAAGAALVLGGVLTFFASAVNLLVNALFG